MSFNSTAMILYSNDKTRLLNFLSDVFEFEVDHLEDSVRFQYLYFIIKQTNLEISNAQIEFCFKVNESDELQELVRKINFFQYRRTEQKLIESFKFVEDEVNLSLIVSDIDGRNWKFDFFKGIA